MGTAANGVGDALIKHVVRHDAWLPVCKERVAERRRNDGARAPLRYFTFSGGEPLDVILLHTEKLLPAPGERGFTSVCFFDRHGADTQATSERIPGAVPFSGSFIKTMLASAQGQDAEPRTDAANEYENLLLRHNRFKSYFPFDVVNFDLEEVLFQPGEPAPGQLMEALKLMFEWQHEHLDAEGGISGFSLMLTLRSPSPDAITEDARTLLRSTLDRNTALFPELLTLLTAREGVDGIAALEALRWERAFELGMPKVVLGALKAARWTVDPSSGFRLFRRENPLGAEHLPLYHIICEVVPMNEDVDVDLAEYGEVVRRLFDEAAVHVDGNAVTPAIRNNLARVMEVQARIMGRQPNW